MLQESTSIAIKGTFFKVVCFVKDTLKHYLERDQILNDMHRARAILGDIFHYVCLRYKRTFVTGYIRTLRGMNSYLSDYDMVCIFEYMSQN